MITWLRTVSCSACNEDSTIFCLNWTESNWDIKINVHEFTGLFISLNVVKSENSLIEFEKVNLICWTFITKFLKGHLCGITKLTESLSSRSTHEWILGIRSTCKCHALSKHFCSTSIHPQNARTVLSKLWMNDWWILSTIVIVFLDILLEKYFLKLNIAIVQN